MNFLTFDVVIERRAGEAEYSAYSPTLTGCFVRGATLEEARRNVHDAIQRRVDRLVADGESIAQGEDLRWVEQLTIGVPERAPGSAREP